MGTCKAVAGAAGGAAGVRGAWRSAEARGVTYSAGGRSLPCTTAVNMSPPISARQSSRCDPVEPACAPECRRRKPRVQVRGARARVRGARVIRRGGNGRRMMAGAVDGAEEG